MPANEELFGPPKNNTEFTYNFFNICPKCKIRSKYELEESACTNCGTYDPRFKRGTLIFIQVDDMELIKTLNGFDVFDLGANQ